MTDKQKQFWDEDAQRLNKMAEVARTKGVVDLDTKGDYPKPPANDIINTEEGTPPKLNPDGSLKE